MTEAGVGEVVDFMPRSPGSPGHRQPPAGPDAAVRPRQMTFAVEIAPRFDYGREPHETHLTEDGVVFEGSRGTR
jgi:hypothetical protein